VNGTPQSYGEQDVVGIIAGVDDQPAANAYDEHVRNRERGTGFGVARIVVKLRDHHLGFPSVV
jgi:hypothetical protein